MNSIPNFTAAVQPLRQAGKRRPKISALVRRRLIEGAEISAIADELNLIYPEKPALELSSSITRQLAIRRVVRLDFSLTRLAREVERYRRI
jgi:hypothetical protein